MGVERGIPNKLAIDANAKSWHQLPRKMREELLKEAKFQTRRIKKKTR